MKRYRKMNYIKSLIFRYIDDEITAMGSQLAYSLLLSFFPFLIILMTLVGYSSIKSEDVLLALNSVLPNDILNLIKSTVVEVVDTRRLDLLSFGTITTIWTASNGFNAVIRGLNKAYDEKEKRSFIKVQFTVLLCTLGLILMVIISFSLLIFGELSAKYLLTNYISSKLLKFFLDFGRYILGFAAMIIVFTLLYRYTPSKKLKFKEVLPGALFTTLGWIIASICFSFYVNNFGNYSKIYGSIGAVIALMSWLFIVSVIILIGGEINATLAYRELNLEKHKGNKY